jgi:hypothetical protein
MQAVNNLPQEPPSQTDLALTSSGNAEITHPVLPNIPDIPSQPPSSVDFSPVTTMLSRQANELQMNLDKRIKETHDMIYQQHRKYERILQENMAHQAGTSTFQVGANGSATVKRRKRRHPMDPHAGSPERNHFLVCIL